MRIGYARVSTSGQSSDGQADQLKVAGCSKVIQETASGAKTNRAALAALLASLKPVDVVVVTRLVRFARSTIELLMILKAIAYARRCRIAPPDQHCSSPAIAFSVENIIRSQGVGSILFERVIYEARKKGYDRVQMTTGFNNERMKALARKFGVRMETRNGDTTGMLKLKHRVSTSIKPINNSLSTINNSLSTKAA